jgi:Tol biopolymer transport system component
VTETTIPSPIAVSATSQSTTSFTLLPPTLASPVQVTPTVTFVPSPTLLSTPATPYPEEWLAFVERDFKGRTGHPNVSILDSANTTVSFIRQDGSGLLQPTMFEKFSTMVEYSLAWSPDGTQLLFDWSNFGATMTRIPVIHVTDPFRRQVTLTDSNNAWVLPSWSPDSQWFVASLLTTVTNEEGKQQDTHNLFRVNSRTFQKDRITTSSSSDLYPSWSPDGQWIAFLRFTPEFLTPKPGTGATCGSNPEFFTGCIYADLYITRRDGSDPIVLRKSVYIHMDSYGRDSVYNNPSWSPDSKWLAMLTGTEQPDITLINIDTKETRVLAAHPALDTYPTWSPDGSKLAFVSSRDGNEEIYIVSREGDALANLTNNVGSDFNPVWSPSGRYLAFLSDREESRAYKLYVMNADGTAQRKLHDGYVFTRPSWFPLIDIDVRTFFGFGSE